MKVVKNNNKGQVALIVLLISAVALTLGLSASKKAITDTKVDKNEAELKDAFNAAESGIDQYLSIGTTGNDAYVNNDSSATANVTTQSIGGVGVGVSSDGVVLGGQNNLFWLVNHNTDGTIGTTYYNKNVTLTVDLNFMGALKIDYFYKNGAVSVNRSGYNFSNTNPIVNGYNYSASRTVSIPIGTGTENALLLVITPIGGDTKLILNGAVAFPVQGEEITAVGQVGSGVKTQVKTVNKYDVPDFFMESVSAINEISP